MKSCTKCGAIKPLAEFRRDSNRPGGLGSWCKPCGSASTLRRYAEYKAETGENYRDRYCEERVCVDCDVRFMARPYKGSVRCPPCAGIAQRKVAAAASAKARRKARPGKTLVPFDGVVVRRSPASNVVLLKPLRRRWYAGSCPVCGDWFIHDQPQTRACSESCARRLQKDRRRARERGAHVAEVKPREIFERDRWTCQLCGKRVAWSRSAPHPRAPVVDHIVPLAAEREFGGVHAPYNVQCAHFLCNSVKAAECAQAALF